MSCLIRNCDVPGRGTLDVRLAHGVIERMAPHIVPAAAETVIDADGGALLPGLHDHHIHLASLAASLDSVHCGPPQVNDAAGLATLLQRQAAGSGWLRGIGYHPIVAGDIDRHWLDRHIPQRPVRVQHRGGRLWILNSAALRQLGLLDEAQASSLPAGIERRDGIPTGRLYECDAWLAAQRGSSLPPLAAASARLAACGITGITDTTPHNGPAQWHHFQREQRSGRLRQDMRMMGGSELGELPSRPELRCAEYKIHLLESQLPDIGCVVSSIQSARRQDRRVAIHCASRVELVFALACLQQSGTRPGDRIEHASVTPPELMPLIGEMGLRVVTQPHFVAERGDRYLAEVEPRDQPWLYRLRGFVDAGIALAAGSDAPFGSHDPWQAMAATTRRRTAAGAAIGAGEALTPE
ncbi:MAG: amidohydrolase family protein, partial [Halioglobus sp.]|nr:amidohydrolase family protein [Halioglobus sp.]